VLDGLLWYRRWGATDDELERALPGDEILTQPIVDITRAVTIDAGAAAAWAWLVQMGQGRGGMFSYDWLENLAGLDIHTINRIMPELQELAVGDPIPLGPGLHNGMLVAAIERERALVLRFCDPTHGGFIAHDRRRWIDLSWAFILAPVDAHTTRLISRFRIGGRPRLALQLLYSLFIEIPHFVMERKMLLGIKQRAERGLNAATGLAAAPSAGRRRRARPPRAA